MYIQPFSMEVDWQEIWHQMDVSTTFYICRYCVFTLWGRSVMSGIDCSQLYASMERRCLVMNISQEPLDSTEPCLYSFHVFDDIFSLVFIDKLTWWYGLSWFYRTSIDNFGSDIASADFIVLIIVSVDSLPNCYNRACFLRCKIVRRHLCTYHNFWY